jgi:hypothetical protein
MAKRKTEESEAAPVKSTGERVDEAIGALEKIAVLARETDDLVRRVTALENGTVAPPREEEGPATEDGSASEASES